MNSTGGFPAMWRIIHLQLEAYVSYKANSPAAECRARRKERAMIGGGLLNVLLATWR